VLLGVAPQQVTVREENPGHCLSCPER